MAKLKRKAKQSGGIEALRQRLKEIEQDSSLTPLQVNQALKKARRKALELRQDKALAGASGKTDALKAALQNFLGLQSSPADDDDGPGFEVIEDETEAETPAPIESKLNPEQNEKLKKMKSKLKGEAPPLVKKSDEELRVERHREAEEAEAAGYVLDTANPDGYLTKVFDKMFPVDDSKIAAAYKKKFGADHVSIASARKQYLKGEFKSQGARLALLNSEEEVIEEESDAEMDALLDLDDGPASPPKAPKKAKAKAAAAPAPSNNGAESTAQTALRLAYSGGVCVDSLAEARGSGTKGPMSRTLKALIRKGLLNSPVGEAIEPNTELTLTSQGDAARTSGDIPPVSLPRS